MLKAKPVWFSLDVFKADPGGYSAARAHAGAARALERAFTGRAVTGEYTEPRPVRCTRERDRIAVQAIPRQTPDLSVLGHGGSLVELVEAGDEWLQDVTAVCFRRGKPNGISAECMHTEKLYTAFRRMLFVSSTS